MIVLNEAPAPRWVELFNGAALFAAPPTTALVYAARAVAEGWMADLMANGEAVTRAGGHLVGLPDFTDELERKALENSLFVVALAERAVTDWRGIGTADGTAIEFDAAYLPGLLADAAVSDAFLTKYLRPIHEVTKEANF